VIALALPIMGYGFVFKFWWLCGVGALVLLFGVQAWTSEPASEEVH